MFWLVVGLLQSGYTSIYAEATDLLRAMPKTLELHGAFDRKKNPNVLLDGRTQLEDMVYQPDHLLCLSRESSFSLPTIISKGVRHGVPSA